MSEAGWEWQQQLLDEERQKEDETKDKPSDTQPVDDLPF